MAGAVSVAVRFQNVLTASSRLVRSRFLILNNRTFERKLHVSVATASQKFSTPIPEFENQPGIESHQDLYEFSLSNPDEFWGRLARSRLRWFQDFDTVKDCDMDEGRIAWFLNGKINVAGEF